MPQSNWRRVDAAVVGVFTAFVFGFILVLTWQLARLDASYTQQAEQAATKYDDSTQNRIRGSCQDMEPIALSKCVDEVVKATQEFQTSQRDLAAQQSMALWTSAMFWSSVASVAVTVAGIFFVAQTLWVTRSQLDEAKASNLASLRSAVAAEETLIASERPWIKVDAVVAGPLRFLPDGEGRNQGLVDIKFTFSNFGKSPAIRVLLYADLKPWRFSANADLRAEFRETLVQRETGVKLGRTVYPDDSMCEVRSLAIWPVEIDKALECLGDLGPRPLIAPDIIGCVAYINPRTNKHHETGFVFSIHRIMRGEKTFQTNMIDITLAEIPASEIQIESAIVGGYVT